MIQLIQVSRSVPVNQTGLTDVEHTFILVDTEQLNENHPLSFTSRSILRETPSAAVLLAAVCLAIHFALTPRES